MLVDVEVTIVRPQIVYLAFPCKKELTFTMCRVQEFYESCHLPLNGTHFSWETFIDIFTKPDGEFDYFSFWSGFNVPSSAYLEFFYPGYELNERYFSKRERALDKTVRQHVDANQPFYVIATVKGDAGVVAHEVAHAFYFVDEEYRRQARELVNALDNNVRNQMSRKLTELGYAPGVVTDEINAYLATSDRAELIDRFEVDAWSNGEPFRDLFARFFTGLPVIE